MRDTSNNEAARLRYSLVHVALVCRRAALRSTHSIAISVAVALAIAQLLRPLTAHAEPELALRWARPANAAQCPDQAWAEARIAEQLGRAPKANVARGVSAAVAIQTGPKGFVLALET